MQPRKSLEYGEHDINDNDTKDNIDYYIENEEDVEDDEFSNTIKVFDQNPTASQETIINDYMEYGKYFLGCMFLSLGFCPCYYNKEKNPNKRNTQPKKPLGNNESYPMIDNNTKENLDYYMENEEGEKDAEFIVQRKQAMINGNFENIHEYGKTYLNKISMLAI